jgi:hypothetical protein
MNQDNKLPPADSDPLVSAEYRAIATEQTPAALDERVLEQAKAAARNTGLRGFTAYWFRPLAFVATLALSLALLLELTNTPELQPVKSPESEFGRREAESFEADPNLEAPRIVSDFHKNADAPDGKQQPAEPGPATDAIETGGRQKQHIAPSAANAPVADRPASADFADAIEASSKQMPGADSVTRNAIQGLRQTRPAAEAQPQEAVTFRASALVSDVAVRTCDEEQTADAGRWWQCIADLEYAGRHAEAGVELDLFNKAHPDFEPPETLPSR